MITLFILLTILLVIGIAVLGIGTGLVVVFLDPIVCILVVILLVKIIKKLKRK